MSLLGWCSVGTIKKVSLWKQQLEMVGMSFEIPKSKAEEAVLSPNLVRKRVCSRHRGVLSHTQCLHQDSRGLVCVILREMHCRSLPNTFADSGSYPPGKAGLDAKLLG